MSETKNKPREIELPLSGKKATVRSGNGWDWLKASQKAQDSSHLTTALAAELVEIEGEKLPYEEILDLPMPDVMELTGLPEVIGPLGLNLPLPDSSKPPATPASEPKTSSD